MLVHPLNFITARQIILDILKEGTYRFSRHAEERLVQRDLDHQDCLTALRTGVVESVDLENGRWRYRVRSRELTVVVEIITIESLRIITIWRILS